MAIILDGTTGIVNPNGNASTPALAGEDSNTGIFFGTDTMAMSINGSERARLTNTGLGIGLSATAPQRFLDLRGTTSAEQIIGISSAATNGKYWNFLVDGGGGGATNSNFSIRRLNDAFSDVAGFGININGTTGVVSTRTSRAIDAASLPAGTIIQAAWNDLGAGNFQTTAATIQDTGFNVNFTPRYSNSRIIHIVTIGAYFICDGQLRIGRGGAAVSASLADSFRDVSTTNYINDLPPTTVTWQDTPNTTSQINYRLYAFASGCGRTCFIGSSSDFTSSWMLMEVAV
jgi:hypothetical protein